jgi:hypothetical protein
MKRLLIQYTWILGIGFGIILLLLLTGCNQPPLSTNKPLLESVDSKDNSAQDTATSIGNMEGIGRALGCVFAPQSCKTQD